ncbi:MAG: TolC family protein [Bacteroidales bacterium]|nr:TolC family protein [Bacteroidales bacterium]
MKINIFIFLIFSGLIGFAQQPYDSVLHAVERNNTTLKALRQSAEAQKLENKTGIFLPGPEAEFGFLWGNSAAGANRTDINITQSFDIPTITGMKGRIAGQQNQAVDWQYASNRREILLDAKLYCIDLVYLNAMANEMNKRLEHAREMEQAFSRRFKSGEANILEYNNMQLNLVSIQAELEQVETERQAVLAQLKRLNGGTSISLNDTEYGSVELPELFEEWYARIESKKPELALAQQEAVIREGMVNLERWHNFPLFSAGYLSEKVGSEQFQGIVAGISIPLWENKNQLARAKTAALAAQAHQNDIQLQLVAQAKSQFAKAQRLKAISQRYSNALKSFDNAALLKKALTAGEISVVTYFVEISAYYNIINQSLEAERDFQKAAADLLSVDL